MAEFSRARTWKRHLQRFIPRLTKKHRGHYRSRCFVLLMARLWRQSSFLFLRKRSSFLVLELLVSFSSLVSISLCLLSNTLYSR